MHTEPPPAAGSPNTRTRDLDRSLLRGIAWTGGGKWLTQIISWAATPIVARLLSPDDYGVASMAMVYVGLVQLVTEVGLGTAIVQRRDLTEDQIARLGGLSVLLGAAFSTLSIAGAPFIARFFGNAEVGPVIVVLSVLFVASGFQTVPRALLTRDLAFRRLASIDAIEALVTTAVTLSLALLGYRYWSLVLGGIAGRVASTVMVLVWRRHRLRWPTPLASITGPVVFGAHVVGSSFAWYTFLNADLAIIGRTLGSAALGSYHMALSLASIPVDRLSALISRVTPAILAKVQHDRTALRRYLLALTEGTSLLTVPAAVGLGLLAREFVLVVLGEDWRAAITPLRLLAFAAVFRSLTPLASQMLFATGLAKRNMQATVATALFLVPLFYVASTWGTAGVALVWLVAYPLIAGAFSMRYAFATCDVTLRLYLRALLPAASAALVMAAAVLAVDVIAADAISLGALLAAKIIVGAATYLGLVGYFHGDRLRRALSLVRGPQPEETPSLGGPSTAEPRPPA